MAHNRVLQRLYTVTISFVANIDVAVTLTDVQRFPNHAEVHDPTWMLRGSLE